jgi:5-methylcytosine-specific restriction protein B
VPTYDNPPPSSDTGTAPPPLNIILYGPPGTGKTFHTASEAVRICDGSLPNDRNELMKRYHFLLAARRIAFVTFHQSYAYEDFVEGLRPVTGSEDGDGQAGFSLKAQDGIFKQIADLARNNHGASKTKASKLNRSQAIFKMSLGRSASSEDDHIFEEAIKGGYVVLGWGGDVDWSPAAFDDFEKIKSRWILKNPDANGHNNNITQIYTLRASMRIGSLIVVSDGNRKFRAIGEVTGDYRYEPGPDGNHRRAVKWLWHSEKSLARELIFGKSFSQRTVYPLDRSLVDWDALDQIVGSSGDASETSGEPQNFVLIIDEINRANISKVFGELITLIEPDKREGCSNAISVTLPYSHMQFSVPANLHIVATMNTADRSIALLDTALRRRFRFKEMSPDSSLLRNIDGINVGLVLDNLNMRLEYLVDREHKIGHAYFINCITRNDIDLTMRESVIPLLVEYFYENWGKVRAVLNEALDEGAFIRRKRLKPPHGVEAEDDDNDRWQYGVQETFRADAYDQLLL